jgi:hypothetical protein
MYFLFLMFFYQNTIAQTPTCMVGKFKSDIPVCQVGKDLSAYSYSELTFKSNGTGQFYRLF